MQQDMEPILINMNNFLFKFLYIYYSINIIYIMSVVNNTFKPTTVLGNFKNED